jgi:hypothetical protein
MLKLQKWDERLERWPNAVPVTEDMIKAALDDTFMEWLPNEHEFRLKRVQRNYIKSYAPTKYRNQHVQQAAPVDRDKLMDLAAIVCRFMNDPLHVLEMRNHGTGNRYTRSQKLFTIAAADFLSASLADIGAIMKRDTIGMRALWKAASEYRSNLKDDLNEISLRFHG